MAVDSFGYCQRVCNCSDCSHLRCTYREDLSVAYHCKIHSDTFPYGADCMSGDGRNNHMRVFKVYAFINSVERKTIADPFYVFGRNKETAELRFKREIPLLDIFAVEQCAVQEAINVLQSENIEII